MSDKIIHSFQERLQLEKAVDELGDAHSEAELVHGARDIVHTYSPELVLRALAKRLDTPSGQLRGGLGHLAALLPPEPVVSMLHSTIADRSRDPQVRITAALILERFMGLEVPATMIGDLQDSDAVALQSLQEAVDAGRDNRHVILEYVTQMREADAMVAVKVMDLIGQLPPEDQVEMLRLIAHDARPTVTSEAILRLEALGSSAAANSAARALYTLQSNLAEAGAAQAQQSLRKLRFRGVIFHPPDAEGWRALVGPADVAGSTNIWLIRMPQGTEETGLLYGFFVNVGAGILQMFGSEEMPGEHLPALAPIGHLHAVEMGRDRPLAMLETPFDYGRWLLAESLEIHQRTRRDFPIPDEYQLYHDMWSEFAPPQVDDYLTGLVGGTQAVDAGALDMPIDGVIADLFGQSAMEGWVLGHHLLLEALPDDLEADADVNDPEVLTAVLERLATWPDRGALLLTLKQALQLQAAWLHIMGDQERGRRSYALATLMPQLDIRENPVVAHLVAATLRRLSRGGGASP